MGDRRPFVFFKGKVIYTPKTGKWVGTVLVQEDSGLPPRHVTINRLILRQPVVARHVPGPRAA